MTTENTSPDIQDEGEDFEALYDSVMNEGDEQTLEAAPEAPAAPAAPAAPPPEPEYEYTWSGQKIKEPLSSILKKAGMGHDYAQKMAEFNRERASWQEKLKLSEQLKEQYGDVDEWVRGNPDKWEKLQAVIQAEKAGHADLDVNHPLFQELQSLKKQLNEQILPTIQETQQEKQRLVIEAEDKTLNEEIQSIRGKYKDLDWDTRDESGRNREYKVLEHASQHGFKSFRSAFLDLYHDDLEKLAEERGKGSLINERLKQAKSGLRGTSSAPTQGLKRAENIKSKSYNELAAEALNELGIT
jgi:hypothetical protein